MESLFVLAAFSFSLCSGSIEQPRINELDFKVYPSCSISSDLESTGFTNASEKIDLILQEPHNTAPTYNKAKMSELVSRFSPSISLNKVSWINSTLTKHYDPQLSIKVRRAELSGFEALLQVSIPL